MLLEVNDQTTKLDRFPRRKKDLDGEVNQRNNDLPWSAPNGFLIHKRVNSQLN